MTHHDEALDKPAKTAAPSVKGYVIAHPILGSELFENENDADKRIQEIACSNIKYPMHTSKFKAWLCTNG